MRPFFRPLAPSLAVLTALVTLALLHVGCGGKDDPAPEAAVQGTWKFTGLTANPGVTITGSPVPISDLYSALVLTAPCAANVAVNLQAGGLMQLVAAGPNDCVALNQPVGVLVEQYTGFGNGAKWSVSGGKMTVTRANGQSQVYDYQVGGGALTLTGTDGTTTYTIKLQQQ